MGHILYSERIGDILEVTIRDYSGARIESRKCNLLDKKAIRIIVLWLKEKYGVEIEKDWFAVEDDFLKF